jgi:hypothetical protein
LPLQKITPNLSDGLSIEFTDKEITTWAGILMVKKMPNRMDFDSCLDIFAARECQGGNRCQDTINDTLVFRSRRSHSTPLNWGNG